jgi:hypothetical protein
MYLPTFLISTLLTLALALPKPPKHTKLRNDFTVLNFHAYEAKNQKSNILNSVNFMVYDKGPSFSAICSNRTSKSFYSDVMWWPCEILMGDSTVALSYQISDNFTQVSVKREWVYNE